MSDLVEPIAIVGLAGRFPGAHDIEEFWANLRDGRTGLRTVSEQDLLAAGVPVQTLRDKSYVPVNGDAPDIDMFDASFFGMTPREATICDPQLRMFLETAHAAVENAGYDPTAVTDVGVFAATGRNVYMENLRRLDATKGAGSRDLLATVFNYPDYVSTLVSYKLNFTGPSMTVLTACSSSLLTLHLAVQALRSGECEMALVGGTEMEMPGHGYLYSPGSPFSKDGYCRSFDAAASGTVFSTGVGAVVLKRLPDAVDSGDHIWAVVRSTAANNDGSDKVGFSAPSVSGQTAVILEALGIGEVRPEEVGYVEAHGTATPLGDPIEVTALNQAFRRAAAGRTLPAGYCGLGSVKSSVGHLGHAAGVASLIKAALCLDRQALVPTLNVTEPNPRLNLDGSPFSLVTKGRAWPRTEGRPRIVGVSSLGFGGTNVHAILEEAPVREPARLAADRPRLVVWSGRSQAAEDAYKAALSGHLAGCGEDLFADTVTTLQEGRTAHPVRAAVVGHSAADTLAALIGDRRRVIGTGTAGRLRPVAFLFPGQGSQHAGMARGLYGAEPAFTEAFDECLDLLAASGAEVRPAWRTGTDADLEPTDIAQATVFAVEYALARMWLSWGIAPSALLGHSIGELVAAAVAGVFTLAEATALVAARGRAMAAMPAGAMLAVRAPVDQVTGLLPDGVDIAAVNGPRQTVISGPIEAIGRVEQVLAGCGLPARRVRTSHAFHSSMMAAAAQSFAVAFDGISGREPAIPVYSAALAAPLTEADAGRPEFWAGQLTSPVRFAAGIDSMLGDRDFMLVEVGPDCVLTSLLSDHADVSDGRHVMLPTLPRRGGDPAADLTTALSALGALWVEGHPVNWSALRPGEEPRRAPIPGYQYQRSRYWATPEPEPGGTSPDDQAAPEPTASPVSDSPVGLPFATTAWVEEPASPGQRRLSAHAVALVPEDPELSMPLVLALQQAGLRITPVRPGQEYHDGGTEFRVRPGHAGDMERLLRTLADRGRSPEWLVHGWSVGPWPAPTAATLEGQLDLSCLSLIDLLQQGTRTAGVGTPPGVVVLTSRSADISGGESVDPVKATLHGLVRTLAREAPQQVWRLVDLGPGLGDDELAAELGRTRVSDVVALRRDRRWIRTERPCALTDTGEKTLRRDGVYLITGGLGGLGLEIAKTIARQGLRPRLALISRTGVSDAAPVAGDDGQAAVRASLDELAALGAEVRVFAADVADTRALQRVADIVTARFGPVNGVFHLAGVPGGGMLLFRDRDAVRDVLRPKVLGTLALEEVFSGRPPLDFFVAFSSRSAVDGLVGSGDYAAANAFLDAYAPASKLARGRAISVNWPSWTTIGMAAGARPPASLAADSQAAELSWPVMAAQEQPFADEHRIDGIPVLPGTGMLDLVYRRFLALVPQPETPGAVRLRDVAMRQPLALGDTRRVGVTFEPGDSGWSFTVSSQPAAGGPTTVHAIGEIGVLPRSAPVIDPAALLDRFTDTRPPEPLNGPKWVFSFGPRWHCSLGMAFPPGGDRSEKLVSLQLAEAFAADLADYPLHPALLDIAVSSARDPEDGLFLPFIYRSVVVHGPLEARMTSHIVRRPAADRLLMADITVFTPDGRVLFEAEGFTMREFQRNFLADAQPQSSGSATEPVADHDDPAAVKVPWLEPGDGIDPELGAQLLLDLLGSRTPRHVTVRPFKDGQPVPLDTRAAAPRPGTVTPVRPPEREPAAGSTLPAPARAAAPAPAPSAPPVPAGPAGDGIAAQLARIWSTVLGRSEIGIDDNFFELGGNSLAAIDLMTMARKEFGVDLSIAALFDYPTLGALTEALRTQVTGNR
jgi:acyl transferase domain-containing protein/acyl carrier protein